MNNLVKKITLFLGFPAIVLAFLSVSVVFLNQVPVQAQEDVLAKEDIFFRGETFRLTQEHQGDIFVLAKNIDIQAKIDGSLYLIGEKISLRGEVTGSVAALGSQVYVQEQQIRGVLMLVGEKVDAQALKAQGLSLVAGMRQNLEGHFYGRFYAFAQESFEAKAQFDGQGRAYFQGTSRLLEGSKVQEEFLYWGKGEMVIDEEVSLTRVPEYRQELVKKSHHEWKRAKAFLGVWFFFLIVGFILQNLLLRHRDFYLTNYHFSNYSLEMLKDGFWPAFGLSLGLILLMFLSFFGVLPAYVSLAWLGLLYGVVFLVPPFTAAAWGIILNHKESVEHKMLVDPYASKWRLVVLVTIFAMWQAALMDLYAWWMPFVYVLWSFICLAYFIGFWIHARKNFLFYLNGEDQMFASLRRLKTPRMIKKIRANQDKNTLEAQEALAKEMDHLYQNAGSVGELLQEAEDSEEKDLSSMDEEEKAFWREVDQEEREKKAKKKAQKKDSKKEDKGL